MKAIRVHAFGAPEVLRYEEAPDPVAAPGEVVIAVEAAGINPADYKFRNGLLAAAIARLPFTPGMDVAGRIAALGEGVTGFAVGEPVLAMLYMMGNGGYAERVALPAAWVARKPAGLSMAAAGALPTPATTATQFIEEGLDVQPGQRLLVTGAAGAVGRIACFAAQARGAHVTGAVRAAAAADLAYVDDVLVTEDEAAWPRGRFDAIADNVGGTLAERLLVTLRAGGVLKTISTDPVRQPGELPGDLDVVVGRFGNHADGALLERVAGEVAAGRLTLPEPAVMRLAEAPAAHARFEADRRKIVLVP